MTGMQITKLRPRPRPREAAPLGRFVAWCQNYTSESDRTLERSELLLLKADCARGKGVRDCFSDGRVCYNLLASDFRYRAFSNNATWSPKDGQNREKSKGGKNKFPDAVAFFVHTAPEASVRLI